MGGNTEKTDVLDSEGRSYSVKGSKFWQVFLYSRYRLVNNTEFHDMGNIANLMIVALMHSLKITKITKQTSK